jgi:hypothetical protein
VRPLKNFNQHRCLKEDPTTYLYLLDGKFYLSTPEELLVVIPTNLNYTNLGGPYVQYCRVTLAKEIGKEEMDLSFEDGARLLKTALLMDISIELDSYLSTKKQFLQELEKDE